MYICIKWSEIHSVMSDSLWPHGSQRIPVHGILQARKLDWYLPNPGIEPRSRIVGRFFTSWVTREALHITAISYHLWEQCPLTLKADNFLQMEPESCDARAGRKNEV